jgi:hypothetical protein
MKSGMSLVALLVAMTGLASTAPAPSVVSGWQAGPIINGVNYSPGVQLVPVAGGVTFTFPTAPPGIHYLTKHATAPTGRTKIVAKFTIAGGAGTTFKEIDCGQATNPNCTPGPGNVRLYLERRGMTFDWRPYRFWSPPVALAISDYSVELPLDPTDWITVNGQPDAAGLQATLDELNKIGLTFGGMFAGHGALAIGNATGIIIKVEVE